MKRPEFLRRVLANCYCRLAPSPIHRIGVFAIRNIPRGRNPFNTFPKYARPGYVRITSSELDALPPKLREMISALFVPTDGEMWLPTCGTNVVYLNSYLNHSTAPNLRTKDGFTFIVSANFGTRSGECLRLERNDALGRAWIFALRALFSSVSRCFGAERVQRS